MARKEKNIELRGMDSIKAGVRKRPALYFGRSGKRATPDLVAGLVEGLALDNRLGRKSEIIVTVDNARKQSFAIQFRRLRTSPAIAIRPDEWMKSRSRLGSALTVLVGATEECHIEIANKGLVSSLTIFDESAPTIALAKRRAKHAPDLELSFKTHGPTFGRLSTPDYYRLAGILRDWSVPRPGLSVVLKSVHPTAQKAWHYPEGLVNLVQEMDHVRWPLHPDELKVVAASERMKMSLCLRFIHAGSPRFLSWVNWHPSCGGSHWEGLGDSLESLFRDEGPGCRPVLFVTNPDTAAQSVVAHAFVAAMHLELPDPRYAGPTKDILIGDDVRAFVREACDKVFKVQWPLLREQRLLST